MTFIYRCRMKTNGLIIGAVAESLTIPDKKLWIEAPANDRRDNDVVITVRIDSEGYFKKLSTAARVTCSALIRPC